MKPTHAQAERPNLHDFSLLGNISLTPNFNSCMQWNGLIEDEKDENIVSGGIHSHKIENMTAQLPRETV